MHDDGCSDLPTLCFRVPLSLSLSLRRPVREFSLRSDSDARMSSCSKLLKMNRIWDSSVSFCTWAELVERRVTLGAQEAPSVQRRQRRAVGAHTRATNTVGPDRD